MSNLRQIGLAFAQYTQDNDGGFPNTSDPYLFAGKRWRWPVMPYLAAGQTQGSNFTNQGGTPSILLCPSDNISDTSFDATSYDYSAAFYHTPDQIAALTISNLVGAPGIGANCVTVTESEVTTPSRKILVGEFYTNHEHTGTAIPVGIWGTLTAALAPGTDRWTGARNYVFADGHAKFVFARQQTATLLDDCPDLNRTPGGVGGTDLR